MVGDVVEVSHGGIVVKACYYISIEAFVEIVDVDFDIFAKDDFGTYFNIVVDIVGINLNLVLECNSI